MNLKEKLNALKQVREFWIHEYRDSQPSGFLSGQIETELCHEVYLKPTHPYFIHVVEANEWTSLIEALEEAVFALELVKSKLIENTRPYREVCDSLIKIDARLSKGAK